MFIFGSGLSTGPSAHAAGRAAAERALDPFDRETPKLAILFVSLDYPDAPDAARAVREVIGDVPVVGGSSGACVFGPQSTASRGVSLVLLGGDDIEVAVRTARLDGQRLVDVVPAAQELARSADVAATAGLEHFLCLVFAPAPEVDGEELVAAVRKGAGARAQLAGGLTGDELVMEAPRVFVGEELASDRIQLAGVFTRKHVGIAARHGFRPVGEPRIVTRADGPLLFELDHRPALDVWLEDARRAGASPPPSRDDLVVYLASHYELGIVGRAPKKKGEEDGELVARAPWRLEGDGAVRLSGAVPEGSSVRVMGAIAKDLLRASTAAAAEAVMRAGGRVAGALVLVCSGRIAALGGSFPEEAALIRERIGAPIGGAGVYGEIAKTDRDVDAFFNTTAVIVAFAS